MGDDNRAPLSRVSRSPSAVSKALQLPFEQTGSDVQPVLCVDVDSVLLDVWQSHPTPQNAGSAELTEQRDVLLRRLLAYLANRLIADRRTVPVVFITKHSPDKAKSLFAEVTAHLRRTGPHLVDATELGAQPRGRQQFVFPPHSPLESPAPSPVEKLTPPPPPPPILLLGPHRVSSHRKCVQIVFNAMRQLSKTNFFRRTRSVPTAIRICWVSAHCPTCYRSATRTAGDDGGVPPARPKSKSLSKVNSPRKPGDRLLDAFSSNRPASLSTSSHIEHSTQRHRRQPSAFGDIARFYNNEYNSTISNGQGSRAPGSRARNFFCAHVDLLHRSTLDNARALAAADSFICIARAGVTPTLFPCCCARKSFPVDETGFIQAIKLFRQLTYCLGNAEHSSMLLFYSKSNRMDHQRFADRSQHDTHAEEIVQRLALLGPMLLPHSTVARLIFDPIARLHQVLVRNAGRESWDNFQLLLGACVGAMRFACLWLDARGDPSIATSEVLGHAQRDDAGSVEDAGAGTDESAHIGTSAAQFHHNPLQTLLQALQGVSTELRKVGLGRLLEITVKHLHQAQPQSQSPASPAENRQQATALASDAADGRDSTQNPHPNIGFDFSRLHEAHRFARQISLMDVACLRRIRRAELVGSRWVSAAKAQVAPNVVEAIKQFNLRVNWVTSTILAESPLRSGRIGGRGRGYAAEFFLNVAEHLLHDGNLNAFAQIAQGLTSPFCSVSAGVLPAMWERVLGDPSVGTSSHSRKQRHNATNYAQFQKLCQPGQMTRFVRDWQAKAGHSFIPPLNVFLQQLSQEEALVPWRRSSSNVAADSSSVEVNWHKADTILDKIDLFIGAVHDPRWLELAPSDSDLQGLISRMCVEQSMNMVKQAQSSRRIKTTTKQQEREFLDDLDELGWGF